MHAKRRGDLGKRASSRQVNAGTARTALDNVAKTFVENDRPSPVLDTRGEFHQHLRRQQAGYERSDPPRRHEKAMPPMVFRYRLRMARHKRARARAHLLGGAVFFAMQLSTYVGSKDRKTRPIQVGDITFLKGNKVVPHSDPRPHLHLADSVSINFGDQKTDIRNEEVTQFNNDDPSFNPVIHWAETVRRIRPYPGYEPTWNVFTYFDGSDFSPITSTEMLIDIRAAVKAIGPEVLGFTSNDVGTHSVRSSFAMMAYLAKEPIYTIMLIGRWSSTAFLNYIEPQIKEFTRGVSSRMLANDTFFHVSGVTTGTGTPSDQQLFGRQRSLRHTLRERNRQGRR